ncbi:hypothetical protein E4T39_02495 [Aureobasidium subglaciale]|nr:hypothetical protein E4T39_02495 [Aureobasidium subglaciale]
MPAPTFKRSESQESTQLEIRDVRNESSPMQQEPRGSISEPGSMPNPRSHGQSQANGQSKPRPTGGSAVHDFAYTKCHPDMQKDPGNARSATQSPGPWKPKDNKVMVELQKNHAHSEITQQAIQAQQSLQAHIYVQDQSDAFDVSMAGETFKKKTMTTTKRLLMISCEVVPLRALSDL